MTRPANSDPPPWVASPPSGASPRRRNAEPAPYLGPPSYPAPPRWGFPQLSWRWPTSVPGTGSAEPGGVQRVGHAARGAMSVLLLAAIAAGLAAFGEGWRYVLLLRSRTEQLTAGILTTSDVWVDTAAVLAIVVSLVAAALVLVWLFRARTAAADASGTDPARPDWQVLVGLLVPGLNLVLPFSVLAELEHAAARAAAGTRPRPSRLLLCWEAAWSLGAVLFVAALLWRLREETTQTLADGVVLHALADLVAAGVAVLTALLVRRISILLGTGHTGRARFERVVRVAGSPEPATRRRRPSDARR